jgi:hypothetical protein
MAGLGCRTALYAGNADYGPDQKQHGRQNAARTGPHPFGDLNRSGMPVTITGMPSTR